ncbi:MAG: hypothetical protein ACI8QC_001689 [Planctomycetota bacterium]|jgi:hypothetical protein
MKLILPLALVPLALIARDDLSTKYEQDRWVVVESSITMETEVTDFEMLIDGEPPEGNRGGGGGDSSTSLTRSIVTADRVMEAGEDGPTRVLREFRSVGGSQTMSSGDQERESQANSPLGGVTLELALEDGEVSASVSDGDSQEDAQLQGHSMTLALDALLPDGDMDEGDSWDLDKEALGKALGLELQQVLFTRPERAEGGGGERGGGRGRRGGGGGNTSGLAELGQIDWEGEAKFGGSVDHDGTACYEISIKFEGSGELPEREFGGLGRDRAVTPNTELLAWVGTDLEIELEGRLLVSIEGHLPVLLELEGELTREMERTMDRGERTMEMSRTTEGTLKIQIEVSTESAE